MTKEEFHNNLIMATESVYSFTCEMINNKLPNKFKYIVKINSSFREGLEKGEMTFPDEKKLNQTTEPINAREVIDILWMDSAIPVWINIQVDDYDENYTHLELECCGRFSKLERHIYHKYEGYQPFHALSPSIPPYLINDKDEIINKFDLKWNKKKL